MNTKLKIGFFADGVWSHEALSLFLKDENLEVSFICPRYNAPDTYLQKEALNNCIDFLIDSNINNQIFKKKLSTYKCDLFVSMSFNQIFDKELINLPKLGIINCHASKLPFYRGRNILNWVLINDEKEFGITVHYVDKGVDTGDIILQKTFKISDHDNYKTLLELSFKECPLILYESVKLIIGNKVKRTPQSTISNIGSYCMRRKSGDELINWDSNARELFNFVRAITEPGPCAKSYVGNNLIKIVSCQIENSSNFVNVPHSHVAFVCEDYFIIKVKDGHLRINNWVCSIKLKIGDKIGL